MCYLFDTKNMIKIIPYIWFIDDLVYLSNLGNELSIIKNYHGAQLFLSISGFILAMIITHIYVRRETNY